MQKVRTSKEVFERHTNKIIVVLIRVGRAESKGYRNIAAS